MDPTQASESSPLDDACRRRRLSRTFSRARWPEYGRLLKTALGYGYAVATLEEFLDGRCESERRPVLILRHDVDQHPASALRMSDIEVALGVRSTWYFRWRTADQGVIEELRRRGGEIGLHYETLSRAALQGDGRLSLDEARLRLREEIAAFDGLFGPIRSVAAHGDTRAPGVRNGDLLRGEEWSHYGVAYDANDAMRSHGLAAWITDRSAAEGGWGAGVDPFSLLASQATPLLCLTHPNNWISGPALWSDRLRLARAGLGGRRTAGIDAPPTG
jgi:hypothetical protein